MTLAAVFICAPLLAILGTWWAWRDYHAHPERYGHEPRDRARRRRWLTRPTRGDTRQPVRHWTARWIHR